MEVFPTPLSTISFYRSAVFGATASLLWTGDQGMLTLFDSEVEGLYELFTSAFGTCRSASWGNDRNTFDQKVIGSKDHIARYGSEVVEGLKHRHQSSHLITLGVDSLHRQVERPVWGFRDMCRCPVRAVRQGASIPD